MFNGNGECAYGERSIIDASIITYIDPWSRFINPKRWCENNDLHGLTCLKIFGGCGVPVEIQNYISDHREINYDTLFFDVDRLVENHLSSLDEQGLGKVLMHENMLIKRSTQHFCRRSFDHSNTSTSYISVPCVQAAIIIPFRARDVDHGRLKNLTNMLDRLQAARADFPELIIVVVEADARAQYEGVVTAYGAAYLFHENSGYFNKSAAVNAGYDYLKGWVEVICVLDCDAYIDDDFVCICLSEMKKRSARAFMPFMDMLFLDDSSTHRVRSRSIIGAGILNGYLTRKSPGGCIWVESEIFEQAGKFDDRFVGWGGEDRDLYRRIEALTKIARLPGLFVHLNHERAPEIQVWAKSGSLEWGAGIEG